MLWRFLRALPLATAVILAGCAGVQTDYQAAHRRVAVYLQTHPDLDPATRQAMQGFDLRKGMTMEQAVATWGRPVVVQRFRGGAMQYWYFGCEWPHFCTTPDEQFFPPPDEIYQSQAMFIDGRVVSWRS